MFEKIKRFPLVKLLYRVPGLVWFYHLSLASLGAIFYRFPSKHIFVVGVTGTKGKTTVLELLNAILGAGDKKTALLSSLRVKVDDSVEKNKTGNSMPGRFYLQRFLRKAVKAGCQYALIEVTSQGVALSRHLFIRWNAGILTNLAPEHIEAHGSFEKYRRVKLDFLRHVAGHKGRVFINRDDKNAKFFIDALKRFHPTLCSKEDQRMSQFMSGHHPVRAVADQNSSKLFLSDFNKENIAAAVSLALDLGIAEKTIREALHNFKGVPGRMEVIRKGPFTAIVDYAHTPDSLEAVYKSLMPMLAGRVADEGRLVCVLGAAGGGRDKWKRPEFGKIAARYCGTIILTDEDPYDENPEEILRQISSGFSQAPNPKSQIPNFCYKILDRREAILKAISLARENDIVVATGKGSEDWIHLAKGKKIPWNEKKVVEEALAQK